MYTIRIPNFEGPLDLLLYFIKRDELNIYDIPIAKISKEFLEYIRLMEIFDLELAGEFLVMAATLMSIKVQMLLPRDTRVNERGEEEEEDPRAELVKRLLEYKQFKDAAQTLDIKQEEQRYAFYRSLFDVEMAQAEEGFYKNASLIDLLRALKRALDKAPEEERSHIIQMQPVTLEEKSDTILSILRIRKSVRFFELVESRTRIHIVVTFLAILELVKNGLILIQQDDLFDDISITPSKGQGQEDESEDSRSDDAVNASQSPTHGTHLNSLEESIDSVYEPTQLPN